MDLYHDGSNVRQKPVKGFPTFLAHFLGEVLILVYLNFAAICFVDEKARENSNIKKYSICNIVLGTLWQWMIGAVRF